MKEQVRRVAVTDPIATARRYDYADAFELDLPEPDPYAPEEWVRAGTAASPGWAKRIVSMLGIRAAAQSPDSMDGWTVVHSTPDVVHLEMSLPLMHVVLVGRRVEPTRRRFTTALDYKRPVLARLVWAFVGMGHRRTAPIVLTAKTGGGVAKQ